jgi:starvation-inducible DNA-binding protein
MTDAIEPEAHPTLSRDDQQTVGTELQDLLFELIDLSLVGRQLDWCVRGPASAEVRSSLGVWGAVWERDINAVAGRMRAIGWWPDGQARSVSEMCEGLGLEPVPVGPVSDTHAALEVTDRVSECITRVRAQAARIAPIDPVTVATLLAIVGDLEHQLVELRTREAR